MSRFFCFLLIVVFALPAHAGTQNFNETSANLPKLRTDRLPQIENQLRIQKLDLGTPVYIRIFKVEDQLELWVQKRNSNQYHLFKTYGICHHSGELGPKLREGDMQSPEGFYSVTEDWMHPGSKYYLAFNLQFPNEFDRAHERTGSALMVHGGCVSEGCFSMRNRIMAEIYLIMEQHFNVNGGDTPVPVHIFPFRMTEENMTRGAKYYPRWVDFWNNLKEGYDLFNTTKIPPKVSVRDKRYSFQ